MNAEQHEWYWRWYNDAKESIQSGQLRVWVGLTLDERIELAQDVDWPAGAYCEYAEKIEAKLKEKNT